MVVRTFSGTQLRRLRIANGLSRQQLAVLTDRSIYSVAAYERGTVDPSADALGQLAAALGCGVDSLYDVPVTHLVAQ